jgi:hypothetical protein
MQYAAGSEESEVHNVWTCRESGVTGQRSFEIGKGQGTKDAGQETKDSLGRWKSDGKMRWRKPYVFRDFFTNILPPVFIFRPRAEPLDGVAIRLLCC